ncbi:hypothetical protein CU098_005532, partial [Rhizopus stolonifer]
MSKLIEQLRRNAAEKQLIELKLQEQDLQEADRITTAEGSSSKRKSDRIENNRKKVKIIKVTATDKIRVKGLQGTLGSNLARLASEIVVNRGRSKYFSYLSKNSIIDISNDEQNSQIALLGGANIKSFLRKFKHEEYDRYSLDFQNVDGVRSLKKKYEELDTWNPKDENERILKKICVHILYPCVYNPSSLKDKYLKKCSEQSLVIRFWGNLFEYYFGHEQNVLLQWGDTISSSCKESNLAFKLDIRIISEKDDLEVDVMNGEVASVSHSN